MRLLSPIREFPRIELGDLGFIPVRKQRFLPTALSSDAKQSASSINWRAKEIDHA